MNRFRKACQEWNLLREPGRSERYADLLRRNNLPEMHAEEKAEPGEAEDKYSMSAFGAHFAEVRVDADLGTVRLAR
jgi:xanthine dehydrogenase YagR molybdenum-binding subunit